MQPKRRFFFAAFALALAFDVASKQLVIDHIARGEQVPVIEGFFYLSHVRNPGAAFSLLAGAPEWFRAVFFPVMALFALGLVVSMLRQLAPRERLSATSLGLLLGGAAGNLLDRFRHGEVVDFLHVELWGGRAWPDFNVADSCIVVGVALLIFEMFASEGEGLESDRPAGGA
jgi:signal peptidase II